EPSEGVLITHLRHRSALERAKTSLDQALVSIQQHVAAECIAADLRVAINAIGEIIGETTTDDILDRIFKEFCIGKNIRAHRSEEHTSELQSRSDLVCRLLLEKKKKTKNITSHINLT